MSERIFLGNGDALQEDCLLEFRLLYEGSLPSCSNSDRRTKEKQEIRRQFHPQLRRLWRLNKALRQLASHSASAKGPEDAERWRSNEEFRINDGILEIAHNWSRAGFDCVPLVTESLALKCKLDILLLRPEENRFIFRQGDIDGQLKTLFDGLRMPADRGETGNAEPTGDEVPFFSLLEDDRLITEVRVVTDQLLVLPRERDVKATDAFVVIHVSLNHKTPTTFGGYFG